MAMEQITFKNKTQYAIYLRQAFSKILEPKNFNIFLHCVTDSYPHAIQTQNKQDDILLKVKLILNTGLNLEGNRDCCPYGSINGVAKFMGESQNVKIDDVIDYSFANNSRYVNTIILAIPKYIELPNGKHEFSSFNGHMDSFRPFQKACLLDISNERFLPTAFTLGYQLLDKETNSVQFLKNDKHFSLLTDDAKNEIMNKFATKIISVIDSCKRAHNATNIEDVFQIMTQKHMELLEDFLNSI